MRRWRNSWWCLCGLLMLLVGCDLEDERDLCCPEETNLMRYRYLYQEEDAFTTYIHRMEYYLFDGEGGFLRTMECLDGDLTKVSLATLPAGSYSLVAVGNLEGYGSLKGYAEQGLAQFRLEVDRYFEQTDAFANGDRLYWGQGDFIITACGSNVFLTEMANIHCSLTVRVEWEALPPYSDSYYFTLQGIGSCVEQQAAHADTLGVQRFPLVTDFGGCMREPVELRRLALQAELLTLRYAKGAIPHLGCYHGEEPLFQAIDLADLFARWGWEPERAKVQRYALRIVIKRGGTIEVFAGLEADVVDWIDGGVIGG